MEINITDDNSTISADKLVTGRTCVIGQSGSGKSYTVAVICEELARKNLGFCIIDTEGEYFSLKEKFTILWVGSNPNADIDIEQVNFNTLAAKAVEEGVPVIFDVSDVIDYKKSVKDFVGALYAAESKQRQPYLLIIEEIDKFAPQSGEMIKEIDEVGRRGRKRGLGLLIATQRPALVNKNILSQCGNQIIGKLTINNDLDAVKIFFPNRADLSKLPMLKPGEFFLQGDIAPGKIVRIKKRETQHKAITPQVIAKAKVGVEELKKIEESIEKVAPSSRISTEETAEKEVAEVKKLAVCLKITKEQAYELIKKSTRQLGLFGKESPVSSLHLILYPVIECKVRYVKKKIIGEEFKEIVSYFDGVTGNVLEINKGFEVKFNIAAFKDLSYQEISILAAFKNKELTNSELENATGLTESVVRSAIQTLSEQKFIGTKKVGRMNSYFVLSKIEHPAIENIASKKVQFEEQKMSAGLINYDITIKQLNNFIKSLTDKAEIIEQKTMYYPFYKATILIKNKSATRFVDAVTGKLKEKI